MIRPSAVLFLGISIAVAAVCARLGIWQLDRLDQRRERNAKVIERSRLPALDAVEVAGDGDSNRFRRVSVRGTPDFEREFVVTHRSRKGSPGVNIITPVRIPGTDSAVLVNRGWIYSPDGMRVDLARWRENDSAFTGYIEAFSAIPSADSVIGDGLRQMDINVIRRTMPYPVRPFYVVAMDDSTRPRGAADIARIEPPPLDEGSHASYAFQWFAFGTIALVGAGIVTARSMRS